MQLSILVAFQGPGIGLGHRKRRMTGPCRFLARAVLGAIYLVELPAYAQALAPTTAPAQNWLSLASSADGVKLAGVGYYGWIYISTNSGATWTAASTATNGPEPQRSWTGIASSADGRRLVAVASFSPVFTSTNSGETWNQSGPAAVWAAVASSSDGTRLIAVDHNMGSIYISRDAGASWNASPAPNRRWRSVASCADGTILIAGTDFGTNYGELPSIYVSTNSGGAWVLSPAPGQPWQALASSADGTRLAAGVYGGLIYLSKDSGTSWRAAGVPSSRWGAIASSADGSRLVAAAWEGMIYFSTDAGQTWTKANAPGSQWQSVACSADGIQLFAGIWDLTGGGIYAAKVPPVLNIRPFAQGTAITWSGPATGYVLQEKAAIAAPNWTAVAAPPSVVGGQNQVIIPSTGGARIYRLALSEAAQK